MALTDFIRREQSAGVDIEPDDELDDTTDELGSGARLCACGCGQVLSGSSKWAYKRGHKLRAVAPGMDPDPEPVPPTDVDGKPVRKARGTVSKKIQDDVAASVGLILGLAGDIITVRDDVCGPAIEAQAEPLAVALTPLLCRSPMMVKFLRSEGNLSAFVGIYKAAKPIVQTVSQHHVMHTLQSSHDVRGLPEGGYEYPIPGT